MMIDPRTIRIIHQQKEKEILQGMKRKYIEAILDRFFTVLRVWFARINQRSYAKPAQECVYEMARQIPCCEEESYQNLQV